jgi:hypothetical protein
MAAATVPVAVPMTAMPMMPMPAMTILGLLGEILHRLPKVLVGRDRRRLSGVRKQRDACAGGHGGNDGATHDAAQEPASIHQIHACLQFACSIARWTQPGSQAKRSRAVGISSAATPLAAVVFRDARTCRGQARSLTPESIHAPA